MEILCQKKGDDSGTWKKVDKFFIDENIPKDVETIRFMKGTVICGINEKDNSIEPSEEYIFEVICGKNQQSIVVKPSGVLPMEAREDKKLNRHNFGWNSDKDKWQKISVEELGDGRVAMLVKVVK